MRPLALERLTGREKKETGVGVCAACMRRRSSTVYISLLSSCARWFFRFLREGTGRFCRLGTNMGNNMGLAGRSSGS